MKRTGDRNPDTILTGEEDSNLWSVSTAKHFMSSLRHWRMQVSLFVSVNIKPVETLCIIGINVKSLLALLVLVRK